MSSIQSDANEVRQRDNIEAVAVTVPTLYSRADHPFWMVVLFHLRAPRDSCLVGTCIVQTKQERGR